MTNPAEPIKELTAEKAMKNGTEQPQVCKNFPKKGKKQRALPVMNKKGKNFQPKKFKTKGCPNCILGVVQQSGTDWSKL